MEAAERELLAKTVRDALDGAGTRTADAVLAEFGWLEMLATEPDEAIAVVFEALGAAGATATALDDVVVAALGREPRADLAGLLPAFGGWDPPGGAGLATARVTTARELLIGDQSVSITSVELRPVRGIDPEMGLHVVQSGLRRAADDRAWERAVALGRRAIAHEIAGATRAMLELACAHAQERVQFGRPVASFQAVRHRLADALVAIEALDATLQAAADEPGDLTAALAKATAARTAATVSGHCQQVLAGIGFTTGHPFHRLLRRVMMLDGLFGSGDAITVDVGHRLLVTGRVPTLIEL